MGKTFDFDEEMIIGLENPNRRKKQAKNNTSSVNNKKKTNKDIKVNDNKKEVNKAQNTKKRNQNNKIQDTKNRKPNSKIQDTKSKKKNNKIQSINEQGTNNKYKVKEKKKPKILTPEQERRKKRVHKIIKICVIVLIIIVAIVLTMFSPLFNIKEIIVTGNNKLSEDTIISLSGIVEGQNTYKVNKSKVEDKIKEENAYIEKVSIKRKLPSVIEIQVQERAATFMIEYGGGYIYLNEQGYMLEISNEKLAIPIIQGMQTLDENIKVGNRICNEDLKKIATVSRIIESAQKVGIAEIITKVDISSEENYRVMFETEKKTAHLGDNTNLTNKMEYIKLFIEDEKTVPGEIFVNVDLNKRNPYFRKQI